MQLAIQDEISRSEDARYNHRLHGVLLVSKGLSCYEVSELLGQNPTTIQRWVNRFNKKGFAGLHEGKHTGRPGKLNEKQLGMLERDLRRDPRDMGYEQNMWDGKLLSHHLENRYGIRIKTRQCQRMFHMMGFRRRKPRPVIASSVPEAQEAFKKTLPPQSTGRS
jgi:transposase